MAAEPFWQRMLHDVPQSDELQFDLAGFRRAIEEQEAARYEGAAESGDVTMTVDGSGRVVDVQIEKAATAKSTTLLQRDIVEAYEAARRSGATDAARRWGAATGLQLDPDAEDPFGSGLRRI
jgi:DNA-binding protein YbaB